MTIHRISSYVIVRDATTQGDPITGFNALDLTVAVPDSQTSFSYTVLNPNPGDLPEVDINSNDLLTAISGISFEELTTDTTLEAFIGEVSWGAGNTTQVMVLEFFGDDEDVSIVVRLGGTPLPSIASIADFEAFENSITNVGAITSGPFAPGANIPFASLPNTTTLADNQILGTDSSDELSGTAGNDLIYTGRNDGEDTVVASAGDDYIVLTGSTAGNFYYFNYEDLAGPITVNIDADWAIASVNKGGLGTDTYIDLFRAANYDTGDGVWFDGTASDDVFNINLDDRTWIGLFGGEGDDTFNITDGNIVRLAFYDGNTGVNVNLNTGVIQDGLGGTDTLNHDANSDARIEIETDNNNDTIVGSDRNERFILGAGTDSLNAGGGWDVLRYDRRGVDSVEFNLFAGTATGMWDGMAFNHSISNVEEVRGSREGNDRMLGNGSDNRFEGRGGNDTMNGFAGNDTLDGGDGNDLFLGGLGDDRMYGRAGNDIWRMGSGTDFFDGGDGIDLVEIRLSNFNLSASDVVEVNLETGDSGVVGNPNLRDTLVNVENVTVIGGNDTHLTGSNAANVLISGFGDDLLEGGGGFDRLFANAGQDTIFGGNGNDSLGGNDGNDRLWGGDGNDLIFGGNGHDTAGGGNNDDRIFGGNGNDSLLGGGGNDFMRGGSQHDTLSGDAGNDTLYGENGFDTLLGGQGNDTLNGGGWGDFLDGGNNNDLILGEAGNDTMLGGAGNDTMDGGSSHDSINGGGGNDSLEGGFGFDTLIGSWGDDTMNGGGGNDRIEFGPGNDQATGGLGADTFVFGTDAGSSNTLFDLTVGTGDRLQLDDALWTGSHGPLTASEVLSTFGSNVGGDFVLTFDGGQTLTLDGDAGFFQHWLIDII
ncbi:calcium-binding protein [Shimia marina]|uniref:Cyclolysin n=1 Tax=Shimia marina TaxID=321267 RepID=A0A0P1FAW7_9RHOB|nr:calcium-binding protein [Shimia marina]CUH51530.1 Cyclolysin [Shimia marina]SFD46860.1 Ca2+-binding protein, RTX toxin-related [Shimia marina]